MRNAWWAASTASTKLLRVDPDGSAAHQRHLYNDLSRRQACLLTQLRTRTGHVGLREFLAHIKVESSAVCAACHVPETVEHYLLPCVRFARPRRFLRKQLKKPLTLPLLMNTPASLPALLRYIRNTERFMDELSRLPRSHPHQTEVSDRSRSSVFPQRCSHL